jgi:hypothetical protein
MAKPKPTDYILTDEEVEFFWTCMNAWQERLGLMDWRITRSTKPPISKALSQMTDWDTQQRQVSCRLARNWGSSEKPTDTLLEQTAVHELSHVLLHPLIEQAQASKDYDEALQGVEHGVINRLEKLFVPGQVD